MQHISLMQGYEGIHLSINNFPLRNMQAWAAADTIGKLHGIRTEARALLNDEILILKGLANV